MAKKKKSYVFQNQLKTIENIEIKINELIKRYGVLNNGIPAALFRTKIKPHDATIYKTENVGKHIIH